MTQTADTPAAGEPTPVPGSAGSVLPVGGRVPFDQTTPEQENTYHHYTGNAIPWIVRGIWILFWCYAITYVVLWLLPSLQSELLAPP
jgi:hypothetical protein